MLQNNLFDLETIFFLNFSCFFVLHTVFRVQKIKIVRKMSVYYKFSSRESRERKPLNKSPEKWKDKILCVFWKSKRKRRFWPKILPCEHFSSRHDWSSSKIGYWIALCCARATIHQMFRNRTTPNNELRTLSRGTL